MQFGKYSYTFRFGIYFVWGIKAGSQYDARLVYVALLRRTQCNVSMASSEIDAKNATQRYSVAQLNLDSPVDSTHKFSGAWKTSAFEWGVLYSLLLWLLGRGVGEGQDIGRRGYALTTIISKKCASLTWSLIFATFECRRDLTVCSSPIFNHPNAQSTVQYIIKRSHLIG